MTGKELLKNKTARLFLLSYLLVMLLPLCIGLFYYYPTTRNMLVDKATDRSVSAMTQLSGLMDTQLVSVFNINTYIASNQQIIEYDILNNRLGVKLAKDQLAQMIRTNTFIEHLFLYMRENQYMIGARAGTFYYREISENPTTYDISFGDISAEELQSLLDTAQKPVVVTSDSVLIFGKRYGKMLLFVIPVPQPRHAYGAALVCVPMDNLKKIIPMDDSEESGNVLFFEDSGDLLYSSRTLSAEVKRTVETLLLSTESMKGTRFVDIDGASHLVTWVTSAKYGWRYANVLPISVVTREVNHFQWITMLITGCVVLLSALLIYIAMKVNYLPISKLARIAGDSDSAPPARRRNDFETIETLIDSLKTKTLTLDERITQAEPQLRRFLIDQLLHGEVKDIDTVLRQTEQMGVDLSQPPYRAAIADYADAQAAQDALIRLLERVADGGRDMIAAEGDEPSDLSLILTGAWSDWESVLKDLAPCRRLALGDGVDEPGALADSFRQAASAIDYMRLNDIWDSAMEYQSLPDRVFLPRSYPLDVMQSLEVAIQHGDGDRVLRLIDQIVALLTVDGAPPYFTRSVYFNAISLLIAGLNRMTGGSNDTVQELGTRSMLGHYTVSKMAEILNSTAQQTARLMSQLARREASVSNIMQLIEEQIGQPTLSLQSVADRAGISASAFSRMFKEKTGRNFKEHVDGLRIAKAKRMLAKTNLSVDQIALEVGYETPTSFYRLFKRYVGIAPGEYRQAQEGKSGE